MFLISMNHVELIVINVYKFQDYNSFHPLVFDGFFYHQQHQYKYVVKMILETENKLENILIRTDNGRRTTMAEIKLW